MGSAQAQLFQRRVWSKWSLQTWTTPLFHALEANTDSSCIYLLWIRTYTEITCFKWHCFIFNTTLHLPPRHYKSLRKCVPALTDPNSLWILSSQFSSSLDFLVQPDSDWFLVCSGQLVLLPLLVSSLTEQWFTAGQPEFAQLLTTPGVFTIPLRTLQPKPDLSSSPAQFNSTAPVNSLSSCSVHGMPFSDFPYPFKHWFLIAYRAAIGQPVSLSPLSCRNSFHLFPEIIMLVYQCLYEAWIIPPNMH